MCEEALQISPKSVKADLSRSNVQRDTQPNSNGLQTNSKRNLIAMASNLIAMASGLQTNSKRNLITMASNLRTNYIHSLKNFRGKTFLDWAIYEAE